MTVATKFQSLGDRIIDKFGVAIKVQHTNEDGSTIQKSTKGVITSITDDDIVDGFITTEDKVCWIKGSVGMLPVLGDVVQFGKNTYTIISMKYYSPDDITKCAYRTIVRP